MKEGRGRRSFPAAPEQSLLLVKATNTVPHGGGQRLSTDSHEYRLLVRWIRQGMPYGNATDPTVARISIHPAERSMRRESMQQVIVVAHYSDGSSEDVTRLTQYDPNNTEMAEVSPTGLVKTLNLAGDVAIMARYQGQVAVFRIGVPLGVDVATLPPSRGSIDDAVFKKLKTLGVPPSAVCDDGSFIRRVTVDIAGRLPTVDETRQFLADKDPARRDKLIDRLLASSDYADYFASKWSAVLRNKRRTPNYTRGTYAFHDWIRESLYQNKPYDQFVREILTASGEIGNNPAVAWYREVKEVDQEVEDCAQLFLGLRIQCARCHHHPFEKWSQRDYYGFRRLLLPGRTQARLCGRRAPRFTIDAARPRPTNPKTGEAVEADRPGRPAAGVGARERSARSAGELDGRAGQSVLCPVAGQSLLEAFLRPWNRRTGRRYAGHEPGLESRVARRADRSTSLPAARPEGAGPLHLPLDGSTSFQPNRTSTIATTSRTSLAIIRGV